MISPLRDALATLLAANSGTRSDSPGVQVWDYRDDFSRLWNAVDTAMPDSARSSTASEPVVDLAHHQVIVWVETPPGDCAPVHTSPYVSPLHWAFCAHRQQRRVRPDTPIRISVLDLNPTVRTDERRLWKTVDALRTDVLPWLRLLRLPDIVAPIEVQASGFVDRVRSVLCPSSLTSQEDGEEYLLDAIRLEFSDPYGPDDRHAISNIVGPVILLGREPKSADVPIAAAPHRHALRLLVAECGLIHHDTRTVRPASSVGRNSLPAGTSIVLLDDPWRHGWAEAQPPYLNDTRIVILDDQWHQGWGEWVCESVGAGFGPTAPDTGLPISIVREPDSASERGGTEVYAVSSPDWLLERLRQDCRFELTLQDSPPVGGEILLLDFRLFAGHPTAERAFIKELIPLCAKYADAKEPWKGFSTKDELGPVTAWCNREVPPNATDPELWIGRTFLARLIALADFTLPIVLFSSTSQADVLKAFSGYENIITSFSKPRTFGAVGGGDPQAFERSLLTALESANQIVRARVFVRSLRKRAKEAAKKARRFLNSCSIDPKPEFSHWRYAELYIDESGTPVDLVGGYVVLYNDEQDAPRTLYAALRAAPAPLVWGYSREEIETERADREQPEPVCPTLPKAFTLKGKEGTKRLRERASKTQEVVATVNLLAGCVLRIPASRTRVGLPDGPDLTYREVASSLVELFLYDWLPALDLASNIAHDAASIKAGVFLATRMLHAADASTLVKYQWNYGLALHAFQPRPQKSPNATRVPISNAPDEATETRYGYPANSDALYALKPLGRGELPGVPRDASVVSGRSMDSNGAYQIVAGIARQRGEANDQSHTRQPNRVARAVGVTMKDGSERPYLGERSFLPRQIHYASDDLLGFLRRQDDGTNVAALGFGFEATANAQLETLLDASRSLDRTDGLPEALNALWQIWDTKTLSSATRWVAVRAAHRLKTMGGREFLRLSRLGATRSQEVGPERANSGKPPGALVHADFGMQPVPNRAGPVSENNSNTAAASAVTTATPIEQPPQEQPTVLQGGLESPPSPYTPYDVRIFVRDECDASNAVAFMKTLTLQPSVRRTKNMNYLIAATAGPKAAAVTLSDVCKAVFGQVDVYPTPVARDEE